MTNESFQVVRRHQGNYPVDVHRIAKELDLSIYHAADWTDSISGAISRDENGYFIIVNDKHSYLRQRFTIAHEIAHFILHRDLIGEGIQDNSLYRSHLSNKLEWQANKLAADILMPWDLIEEAIVHGNESVNDLAKAFKVSKSAMSIRLGIPAD